MRTDQIVDVLKKQGPTTSFEGMIDTLVNGGSKACLRSVHPGTASLLLRGAGESTVRVSGRALARTSGWTGEDYKRSRDVVAYSFASARAWLEWAGERRASATVTRHGFDAIVAPHGRVQVPFGPGDPGHGRLVAAGVSPILTVSLALGNDDVDGTVLLESSMETDVGRNAAATGRIVNVMVIDHQMVGGELFYLALRVSTDDGDASCRACNVTRPPPVPTPSEGQTESQPFVAFGELGWISASAVKIMRGIDFIEEQVTRLGECGSSHRMPAQITLAFQCFYATKSSGVLKWA